MMKIFRFSSKTLIFLLMACTLVCAFGPIHAFAQDGRESLEIARQKERLDTFIRYSDLSTEVLFVDGSVSQLGQLLYQYLLGGNPYFERQANVIANDVERRLKHLRGQIKNEQQLQDFLSNFEKALADYKTKLVALVKARVDFSKHYFEVVNPLLEQLERAMGQLAKMTAKTDDARLSLMTDNALYLGKIRANLWAFYHGGEQEYVMRALQHANYLSAELRKLKEITPPETATAVNELNDIMERLLRAVDSLYKTGRTMGNYSSEAASIIDKMKDISKELADVLLARHFAALQDVGKNMF